MTPPRSTQVRAAALRSTALALALAGTLGACAGEARAAWPNGVARFEGQGKPGAEEGAWVYWYDTGSRREAGSYAGGLRVGVWTEWYRNGQRASEGRRVPRADGSGSDREGPWRFWHGIGQLSAEGEYRAGERQGTWSYWKEDGTLDPERSGEYTGDERRP